MEEDAAAAKRAKAAGGPAFQAGIVVSSPVKTGPSAAAMAKERSRQRRLERSNSMQAAQLEEAAVVEEENRPYLQKLAVANNLVPAPMAAARAAAPAARPGSFGAPAQGLMQMPVAAAPAPVAGVDLFAGVPAGQLPATTTTEGLACLRQVGQRATQAVDPAVVQRTAIIKFISVIGTPPATFAAGLGALNPPELDLVAAAFEAEANKRRGLPG